MEVLLAKQLGTQRLATKAENDKPVVFAYLASHWEHLISPQGLLDFPVHISYKYRAIDDEISTPRPRYV